MNVEKAHEDADHYAFFVEILVFFYLFYYYYVAVSGCYDKFFGIVRTEKTYRATEKVKHHTPYRTEDYGKSVEWHMAFKGAPQYYSYRNECHCAIYQGICSLSVYSYLLEFLYSFSHWLVKEDRWIVSVYLCKVTFFSLIMQIKRCQTALQTLFSSFLFVF